MPTVPEHYSVFGLTLASDLPLPELAPTPAAGRADVQVSIGSTPRFAEETFGFAIHPGGALLIVPKIGRYWITNGQEIVAEPEPDASPRNVRLYLLGSAIGAILHQRSLLPLHANGIAFGDRAVCFMGRSGAGKSTLAAWFHDRGAALLADDVCVVRKAGDGTPLVHPGIPRLRLWREALEASGRTADHYELAFDDAEKYNLRPEVIADDPLPLSHVYLLREGPADEPVAIHQLKGVDSVDALVANTYRGGFLSMMRQTHSHLVQCMALARRVPVYEAIRPWNLGLLDDVAAALEAHAWSVARSSRRSGPRPF